MRFLSFALLVCSHVGYAAPGYDYYIRGNSQDAAGSTTSGLVLMGGGSDVSEAFRWMIDRSGGGDFVVLRASGDGGYNNYIYALGAVDSVETFVIKTKSAAADPFIVDRVRKAEAVFLAGGNQWDYMRLWSGSPLEAAMQEVAGRAPFGGTSAGVAVLGQWVYTAQFGSVVSSEALANPYDRRITLAPSFLELPTLAGLITDSHFSQRDRMGRLVTFLARLIEDGWTGVARGIGVDEATALLVETDGKGRIAGFNSAYLLQSTIAPEICQERTPLTFRNIAGYRLGPGDTFDLKAWTGAAGSSFTAAAVNGVLTVTQ